MSTIVISHMYAGAGTDAWYPTLHADFTAEGHQVVIPDLPDSQTPAASAWLETLAAAAEQRPADDTVLVGHSLGGVNTLRLLEQHDTEHFGPYAGLLLVASMAKEVGYDALAGFFEGGFAWDRIRRAVRVIRVLHTVDDPVTGAATGEHIMTFARELGAVVSLLPTGGHLPSTGVALTELPEASLLVRELLP